MTTTINSKARANRRGTKTATPPKRVTKKNQLIKLLSGRSGAKITEISERFGWQSHSTRAALSGLRKAGYTLTSAKAAKGKLARYKITALPYETAPAAEAPADAR
jgi:DNA-binding IclR family transcriptional regulator